MKLTEEQKAALRKVVAAKLALWDASQVAEDLLGRDIDTQSESLDDLCGVVTMEKVPDLDEDDLSQAFELDTE